MGMGVEGGRGESVWCGVVCVCVCVCVCVYVCEHALASLFNRFYWVGLDRDCTMHWIAALKFVFPLPLWKGFCYLWDER